MKIIAGGVAKAEVAEILKPLLRSQDEVTVSGDMDAAVKLQTQQADFYLGTCHTGAGASLGVLVGVLGGSRCHTFGRGVPAAEEVDQVLADGAVALGFSMDQIHEAVPVIYDALIRKVGV